MQDRPVRHIVISRCSPEIEKEYNTWLNDTHVPMLLEFKGCQGAAVYRLVRETEPHVPNNPIDTLGGYSEGMLVLEFDNWQDYEAYERSPEYAAAVEEARTHDWRGLQEKKLRVQYELVRSWQR